METVGYRGFTIEIEPEEWASDPREWDNYTTMVCLHKNYRLGDPHNYTADDFDGWDDLKKQIKKDNQVVAIEPLYLYDHSGLTISTKPYGDRWDSGQVGWVFVTKEQAEATGGNPADMIKADVATYDQYLTGDVWRYQITDDYGDEIDSFGDIYGYDYTLEEAKAAVDAELKHRNPTQHAINARELHK